MERETGTIVWSKPVEDLITHFQSQGMTRLDAIVKALDVLLRKESHDVDASR